MNDTTWILISVITTLLIINLSITVMYIRLKKLHNKTINADFALTIREAREFLIRNVYMDNEIHPLVKRIYNAFINNPTSFTCSQYTLYTKIGIEVWAANDISNRRFTVIDLNICKDYKKTIDEFNNELTDTDKVILDTIINRVRLNSKEFIHRVFI